MTQILRQSTQVVVRIGVAVAVGDGFTPVTTLALGTADEAELLKAAGAATVSIAGNTFAAITGADGWYDLTLSTTDTNTIGTLDVVINDDSLILPIYARFQVIEEAAYDTIYAASALPASTTNITAGTITTATNVTTVNGLAANVITAAATAADFGTEVGTAVWATTTRILTANTNLNDPTAAAIADAVWDEAQADHVTAGSFGITASEIADILVDTAEIGAAGAGLTAINLPDQTMNITGNITGNLSGSVGSVTGLVTLAAVTHTGAVIPTVTTVTGLTASDVGAIKTQTDKMVFTVANQIDANVQYINDTALIGDGGVTPWGPA